MKWVLVRENSQIIWVKQEKILSCALSSSRISPFLLTVLARVWFNGSRWRMKRLMLLKSQETHSMHFRKFALITGSNLVSCIEYSLEEVEYHFWRKSSGFESSKEFGSESVRKLHNLGQISVKGYHQEVNFKSTLMIWTTALSAFQIQTLTAALRLNVFPAFCSGTLGKTPFYHIHSFSVTKNFN